MKLKKLLRIIEDEKNSTNLKKYLYKNRWFIALIIILLLSLYSGWGKDDSKTASNVQNENLSALESDHRNQTRVVSEIESGEILKDHTQDSVVSTEYESAHEKAIIYINTLHMSKRGVYDQLTSEYGENFSQEAGQYAISQLDVDWKKAALLKGETYAKTMNMSKQGVFDQLKSDSGEKFTTEEAQFAIDHLNVDWRQNALKKAQTFQKSKFMSKEAIRNQLISTYGEKFTAEEANFAIENLD